MRGQSGSLSDAILHRDSQSERRKEQNRNAQRRLRERREQYALRLENEVHQLRLKCRQHETDKQHLTELLNRVNNQHGTIMDQFISAYNETLLCKVCGTAVQRSTSATPSRSHQSPNYNRPSRSQSDASVTQSLAIRQRGVELYDSSSNVTAYSEGLGSSANTVNFSAASAPIARKACQSDRGGRSITTNADSTLSRAMATTFSAPQRLKSGISDEVQRRKTAVREEEISNSPVPLIDLSKLKPPSTTDETAITDPSVNLSGASHLQQAPADLNVWLMRKQPSASSRQSGETLEVNDSARRTTCTGGTACRDAAISGHSQKEALFSMALNSIGLTSNVFSSAARRDGSAGEEPTPTDASDTHRAATMSPWSQLLQVPLEKEFSFNT